MTTDTSDARLVALLDGALADDVAQALRAEIAGDRVRAARLAALDVDLGGLKAEWDGVLAQAPPIYVPTYVAGSGSLWRVAAAAVIAGALILGGMLIGMRSGEQADDWRDFAAAYHLLYRTETLAGPMEGDGGVALVSDALGIDLSALAQIDGLDFRRAQILGWEDQTLIQFAYLDAQGRPVALCVMAANGVETAQVDRHGLPTVSFQNDTLQVLVIGAYGMQNVDAVAAVAAARL